MSVEVIEAAARSAPPAAGVYFFLDDANAVIYIGKAGDLRARLRGHLRGARTRATGRDVLRARLVSDIRWELSLDEDAAAAREADLIVVFQPVLNASIVTEGRWAFVVTAHEKHAQELRLSLVTEPDPADDRPGHRTGAGPVTRTYGCFAHLGVGMSSRPGIACSEGYAALVRLLWAAGERDGAAAFPSRIAGVSPPSQAVVPFEPALAPALHRFLSGTGAGLVDQLGAAASDRRPPFQHPGLRRDAEAARSFFRYGPAALRALRRRHGLAPGPIDRATTGELLVAEVRDAVGPVGIGVHPDPTGGVLGPHESRRHVTRAAYRRRR